MKVLKIIMKASGIPDNATVTMKTGEKRYVLKRTLRVFYNKETPTVISAHDGAVFLVAGNGDANCHDGSKQLVWYASYKDVQALISPEEEE